MRVCDTEKKDQDTTLCQFIWPHSNVCVCGGGGLVIEQRVISFDVRTASHTVHLQPQKGRLVFISGEEGFTTIIYDALDFLGPRNTQHPTRPRVRHSETIDSPPHTQTFITISKGFFYGGQGPEINAQTHLHFPVVLIPYRTHTKSPQGSGALSDEQNFCLVCFRACHPHCSTPPPLALIVKIPLWFIYSFVLLYALLKIPLWFIQSRGKFKS